MLFAAALLSLFSLLFAPPAHAQGVPPTVSWQGILYRDGAALPDGTYGVKLSLYGTESGGAPLWSEMSSITCAGGVFQSVLGSVVPLPPDIPEGELWLEVELEATLLTPRIPIHSVPYALKAGGLSGSARGVVRSLNGLDGALWIRGEGISVYSRGDTLVVGSERRVILSADSSVVVASVADTVSIGIGTVPIDRLSGSGFSDGEAPVWTPEGWKPWRTARRRIYRVAADQIGSIQPEDGAVIIVESARGDFTVDIPPGQEGSEVMIINATDRSMTLTAAQKFMSSHYSTYSTDGIGWASLLYVSFPLESWVVLSFQP